MKKIYLIIFCSLILGISNSQPISPATTGEYCPDFEYTFTVTIPKTYQSMIGSGGCYVTQMPVSPVGTTFNFKGKFGDANQKQTFRIFYTDNTYGDFEYKKIKSLFFTTSNPAANINPNLSSIIAPRCQISTYNFSFNNIQFATVSESPEIIFGSVTSYEYLLPVGWKLNNGVASDGTTWQTGINMGTITSDLSNGDAGFVKIRAVNPCSAF